jgi:hypothetical protein
MTGAFQDQPSTRQELMDLLGGMGGYRR